MKGDSSILPLTGAQRQGQLATCLLFQQAATSMSYNCMQTYCDGLESLLYQLSFFHSRSQGQADGEVSPKLPYSKSLLREKSGGDRGETGKNSLFAPVEESRNP